MKKTIETIYMLACTDKYFRFVLPAVVLVALAVTIKLLLYNHFNGDVGYYLLCARDIAHGSIPYADFKLLYPPVAVSAFSIPFLFFGDVPDFSAFLLIQYIAVAVCALIAWLIIKVHTQCKTFASIIALVVFLYILQLEGKFIVLEPITLCFGLLSLWCLINEKPHSIFMSGIFVGLAFLSKQYGLGFGVPCVFYLVIAQRTVPKNLLLLFGGFMVPMLAFFAVCFFWFGLSYADFFNVFWNSSYGIRTISAFGSKLATFFSVNALLLVPSILLLIALYYHKRKQSRPVALSRLEATLLCTGVFMVSTYFFPPGAFRHYAIFIIPFILLSLALYFFRMAGTTVFGKYILLIFVMVAVFSVNPIIRWVAYGMNPSYRSQQVAIGKALSAVVPPGSKVTILSGELEINRFLCSWPSPLPESVGYDWYYMITPRLRRDLIDHSDFVLAHVDRDTAVLRDLDGLPFVPLQTIGDIRIFHRVD